MKQQVINYQFEILQNQLIRKNQSRSCHMVDPFRYTFWKLNDTLKAILTQKKNSQIKWIGNCPDSFIISYFYCVMKTCSGNSQLMIKLKHSLYKVCQYCLNLSQQRNLVQFLNILQDQGNIDIYLKSNRHTQDLLVKIYQTSMYIAKIDVSNSGSQPFQKLKLYSKRVFPFLTISTPITLNDVLQIKHQENQPLYVIRQKDCYFVLDRSAKQSIPPKSPQVQECIINQEVQEETVLIQNGKLSSRSKTDSQTTSKEKVSKLPKFLNHSQKFDEKQRKQHSNPIKNKAGTVRQNYSNLIITNFQLGKDKSEDTKLKKNQNTSKSIKNASPQINHSPSQKKQSQKVPTSKTTHNPQKTKFVYQGKNTNYHVKQKKKDVPEQDSILGKVNSFSKLPSNVGIQNIKSQETIRNGTQDFLTTEQSKKKNTNKSIIQKDKIHIYITNRGVQQQGPQSNKQSIMSQNSNIYRKFSSRYSNVNLYHKNQKLKPK